MSKRAEEESLKAYPPTYTTVKRRAKRVQSELVDTHKPVRAIFQRGYEQGEKDTTQRALDWLKAHTKSYVGPIEEPFWTMFIEHFKKAMEEE